MKYSKKDHWLDYKKNNLKLVYRNITDSWCQYLPFKYPFIEFLKKFSPENVYYKLMKLRFCLTRKPIMPTCEYIVTTKCTMNCKNCNTFIPYFSEKTHFKPTTFEQFKKDLDILLKSVDYIDYFGFVGGEPLIVKDLPKMIKYALSKKQLHHVFMASNATILPSEELLKVMKHKRFALQLSDYRIVKELESGLTIKFDEYKKLLIEHGIQFSTTETDDPVFVKMPDLYKDKQDEAKVKSIFNCCWGQHCNMLCDGILTQCTLSVYISRNLELTPELKDELVDIRAAKSSKELTNQIMKFYAKPYSQFCHYCHPTEERIFVPRAEQAEGVSI